MESATNAARAPMHCTKINYDVEAAYERHMNPKSGFQSGLGDFLDADYVDSTLSVSY